MREDGEEKKEFLRQQNFRRAEREARVSLATEAAEVKASILQGVLDEARGNLIQGRNSLGRIACAANCIQCSEFSPPLLKSQMGLS